MSSSLQEALMLGIYTLIFITALTAGIMLMANINDMVDYVKQLTFSTSSGNLMEEYGDTQERTFKGTEIYSFYGQYKEGNLKEDLVINVVLEGEEKCNLEEFSELGISYLDEIFTLRYIGENNLLFELKTEELE